MKQLRADLACDAPLRLLLFQAVPRAQPLERECMRRRHTPDLVAHLLPPASRWGRGWALQAHCTAASKHVALRPPTHGLLYMATHRWNRSLLCMGLTWLTWTWGRSAPCLEHHRRLNHHQPAGSNTTTSDALCRQRGGGGPHDLAQSRHRRLVGEDLGPERAAVDGAAISDHLRSEACDECGAGGGAGGVGLRVKRACGVHAVRMPCARRVQAVHLPLQFGARVRVCICICTYAYAHAYAYTYTYARLVRELVAVEASGS